MTNGRKRIMANKTWDALSQELAQTADEAGRSLVALQGWRHPATGILLSVDSIVTVNHAVRHEGEIPVALGDGIRASARVAGRDPGTDLAVLRLEQSVQPTKATPVRWATDTKLRVGELTLALARTRRGNIVASSGIISGLIHGPWRTWRGGELDQFLRPDLTMYSGFSGGPLLNSQGDFLGLNNTALHRSAITIPAT